MRGTEREIYWAQEILTKHLQLADSHLHQITARLEHAITAAENQRWDTVYNQARLAIACNYAKRLQEWKATDIIDAQTVLTSPYATYDAIWTIINKIARADLGMIPAPAGQEDRPTLH